MPALKRRHFLRLVSGSMVGCSIIGKGQSIENEQESIEWPQHQVNAANTGYHPDATGVDSQPTKRWEFLPLQGTGVTTGPVLSKGIVYLPLHDGNLYALSAGDGTELWRFETDGPKMRCTAAVAGDTVIFGPSAGPLYGLSTEDGSEQWKVNLDSYRGSPAVADDTVYIAEGAVRAINPDDGSIRWETEDVGINNSVAVSNGLVYAPQDDTKRIHAFDADSGDKAWTNSNKAALAPASQPTVAEGQLYLGGQDRNLHALDANSGEHLWLFETEGITEDVDRQTVGDEFHSSPAVHETTVYFCGMDGNIYAVDAADGSEQWRINGDSAGATSPSIAAGTVYAQANNAVFAIEADTGDIQWKRETQSPAHSSIIVGNGRVYYSTSAGSLYAIGEGDEETTDSGTETTTGGAVVTPEPTAADSTTPRSTKPTTSTVEPTVQSPMEGEEAPESNRQRGFFSNSAEGEPGFLSNVFNLTMLGFLLSVAGIIHQMMEG